MTYPFGIDVSKWQGAMDWQCAKDAGVAFAFVKATEGASWVDPTFAYNWAELERLNIPHGAYHFFRPKQAVTQVEQFVAIAGEDAKLVLDLEDTGGLDRSAMTVKTLRALELIKQLTGKYPIVYSRYTWLNSNVIMSMMPEVDYWLAQYRYPLPYPLYTQEYPTELIAAPIGIERQQIKFHQSGERGNGGKYGAQSRYIDTDRFIGTNEELVSYFGGTSETQPEQPPTSETRLYQARVIAGVLNVRSSPEIADNIVGQLTEGAIVDVFEEREG